MARAYTPGATGIISGTNGKSYGAYVIAIPSDRPITDYTKSSSIVRGQSIAGSTHNCDMPVAPPAYMGTSIDAALDYYLKLDKFNYNWNQRVAPGGIARNDCAVDNGCDCLTEWEGQWNGFAEDLGGFKIPQLAVWVEAGESFVIENVMPGSYNVYISTGGTSDDGNWGVDTNTENYGELFFDGDFEACTGNPVAINAGSSAGPVTCNP